VPQKQQKKKKKKLWLCPNYSLSFIGKKQQTTYARTKNSIFKYLDSDLLDFCYGRPGYIILFFGGGVETQQWNQENLAKLSSIRFFFFFFFFPSLFSFSVEAVANWFLYLIHLYFSCCSFFSHYSALDMQFLVARRANGARLQFQRGRCESDTKRVAPFTTALIRAGLQFLLFLF
jgi:hypothetical protein